MNRTSKIILAAIISIVFVMVLAVTKGNAQTTGASRLRYGQTLKKATGDSLIADTVNFIATKNNVFTAGGSGTVTSIATGLGLSGGNITTSGTLLVDTASTSILSRQRAALTYAPISVNGTVTSVAAGYGTTFTTITSTGSVIADTSILVNKAGTQTLTNKTLVSPTLTTASLGSSTATTQTSGDNSTKVATTAYVDAANKIFGFSRTTASGTATAAEEVIASKLIPAGTLGNNDRIEVVMLWSGTGTTGSTKTMRVRLHTSAAVGGTIYSAITTTSSTTYSFNTMCNIWQKGASNAQEGSVGASASGAWGGNANAILTSALSTASDMYIVFTTDKDVAGDTMSLNSYDVVINKAP